MPKKQMKSIKNVKAYEAMRAEGMPKQKAAKIANSKEKRKR